eukprot:347503-Chlamydomonas_euryale.AAC.1
METFIYCPSDADLEDMTQTLHSALLEQSSVGASAGATAEASTGPSAACATTVTPESMRPLQATPLTARGDDGGRDVNEARAWDAGTPCAPRRSGPAATPTGSAVESGPLAKLHEVMRASMAAAKAEQRASPPGRFQAHRRHTSVTLAGISATLAAQPQPQLQQRQSVHVTQRLRTALRLQPNMADAAVAAATRPHSDVQAAVQQLLDGGEAWPQLHVLMGDGQRTHTHAACQGQRSASVAEAPSSSTLLHKLHEVVAVMKGPSHV